MVLLIPDAVRKIYAEGWAEGYAEGYAQGLAEGRAAQRKRYQEAYDRFGVELDGVLMLPNTPEFEKFLSGQPEQQP